MFCIKWCGGGVRGMSLVDGEASIVLGKDKAANVDKKNWENWRRIIIFILQEVKLNELHLLI